jgi:hypothetical protein
MAGFTSSPHDVVLEPTSLSHTYPNSRPADVGLTLSPTYPSHPSDPPASFLAMMSPLLQFPHYLMTPPKMRFPPINVIKLLRPLSSLVKTPKILLALSLSMSLHKTVFPYFPSPWIH